MSYWNYFPKAPSVAQRKKGAEALIAELSKKGGCSPVVLQGQKISNSYWGKAWCKHIEGWHDHANRLERGRSYVRACAVVDLRLEPGQIIAKVNGSSLYKVRITVTALPAARWKAFKTACFGQVGSLLDLLQGKLPEPVLQQLTSPEDGLFPRNKEMQLGCDCPDGAYMCKHVAAVLYGVGSRLDTQPELLFALRGVDHTELVAHAATAAAELGSRSQNDAALREEDLAAIFGIELATVPEEQIAQPKAKALRKGKVGNAVKELTPKPARRLLGKFARGKGMKGKDGPIATKTPVKKKTTATKPKGAAKAVKSTSERTGSKVKVKVSKTEKTSHSGKLVRRDQKGVKASKRQRPDLRFAPTGRRAEANGTKSKAKPTAKRGTKKVKSARAN